MRILRCGGTHGQPTEGDGSSTTSAPPSTTSPPNTSAQTRPECTNAAMKGQALGDDVRQFIDAKATAGGV
jgi:hypothetical protein